MAVITGLKDIEDHLEKIKRKYSVGKKPTVIVGYTANYAIHVHENARMEARRRMMRGGKNPKAQWKFLEQPFREYRGEFLRLIKIAVKKGLPVIDALYIAGLRLQRESQALVPLITGNLKASAFTKKENG